MTPPASIMGQIVVAGIYRQQGPNGGELYPAGKTGLLVELIPQEEPRSQVLVWRPVDRNDLASWEAISTEGVTWKQTNSSTELLQVDDTPQAAITIDGEQYEVKFPSEESRRLSLRTTSDWIIRPRILKVTGVAEAFILGGDRKQYQVRIDPSALLEYDVTLQEVEQALKDSNINTSGGFAVKGETERPIRVLGRLGPEPDQVLHDLRQIPVKANEKRSVLLGQVANIVEGAEFKRGDGSVSGRPGVVFTIVKQPHVDTRGLTERLETAFSEAEDSLTADIVINPELFQLRNFIDRGIFNVGEALVIGAVLVIIILFLFLLNFRTTFITLTAIPLSLVITTLVFRLIGWVSGTELSINVMTLGGLAVAMGELVDDAIVDVENIFRRLKENRHSKNPRHPLLIVFLASTEVRNSIVFGTMIVCLVFMPLFALSGMEGRLFAPLGVAYIVSIVSSLLVSLTVTPVLAYWLLGHAKLTEEEKDGFLLRGLKWVGDKVIRFSLAFPRFNLTVTALAVVIAGVFVANLERGFLPPFNEGAIQLNVVLPPGTSLAASNDINHKVKQRLLKVEDIDSFVRRTGRAELDEHAEGVNMSEYILELNSHSPRSREEQINEVREAMADIPGIVTAVEQPIAHLISHMVSGVKAPIGIKIYGDDLDELRRQAEGVRGAIAGIPGVRDLQVEPQTTIPQLRVEADGEKLKLFGLRRNDVNEFVQTAMQGEVVSQVLDGQRTFDLMVRLGEEFREDVDTLRRLRIDLPAGGTVKLEDV
ncbi:MAG: efflux RND transporter permease subunit, partial [Planctomycetales bacterium]|nr:efflux RND transporter permease subunit [Planctomycetales bacterium]